MVWCLWFQGVRVHHGEDAWLQEQEAESSRFSDIYKHEAEQNGNGRVL